jgi:hypothetical protein
VRAVAPQDPADGAERARDAEFVEGKPTGVPFRDSFDGSPVPGSEGEHPRRQGLGSSNPAKIEESGTRQRVVGEVENSLESELLSFVELGGEGTELGYVAERGQRPGVVEPDAERRRDKRAGNGVGAGAPLRNRLVPLSGGGTRANREAEVDAERGDAEIAPPRHTAGEVAGVEGGTHLAETPAERDEDRFFGVER